MNFKEFLEKHCDKFSTEEILQLQYLYSFLEQRGDEYMLQFIVNDWQHLPVPNADNLQEIIKCVTHDIPYGPILYEADTLCMTEVRRFMEDTHCEVPGFKYMFIAQNLLKYIDDKNVIYEFRRFNKGKKPIGYVNDLALFLWIIKEGRVPWMVIAAMYEVYMNNDFDVMMNFALTWESKAKNGENRVWPLELQLEMWNEARTVKSTINLNKKTGGD